MFGSQVLETAIGLALIFWVLASAASALAEVISRFLQKRAKDFEVTLAAMLVGTTESGVVDETKKQAALELLRGTSIYGPTLAAARRAHSASERGLRWARPAYLSARSFADMAVELGTSGELDNLPELKKRVTALAAAGQADTLALKAGLESWFDETMSRVQDAYKRWVTVVLFVIGLLLAGFGNVSTIAIAHALWTQPVTRQIVADQAAAFVKAAPTPTSTSATGTPPPSPSGSSATGSPSGSASSQSATPQVPNLQDVEGLGLPLGWPHRPSLSEFGSALPGILLTALLVMLGAPFWFDALSRLVSLRTTGAKPPPAPDDRSSATRRRAEGATSDDPPLAFVAALQPAVPPPPTKAGG